MRYLVIEDGVVVNAVVADEPLYPNWVRSDVGVIGDLYDGETFTTPPMSQAVIDRAWADLRVRRDGLLGVCDWTQAADAPLSVELVHQWREYRQALRDLPSNTADPFNPVWPTPPGAQ